MFRLTALFAVVNAAICYASAFTGLMLQGWPSDRMLATAVIPYAFGGLVGGALTVPALRRLFVERSWTSRMAFGWVALASLSGGFTILWYVFEYRIYFSQWHSSFLSVSWFFQNVFTAAGAVFLFLSTGAVLFVPWAVIGWIAMAWALSRPPIAAPRVEATERL